MPSYYHCRLASADILKCEGCTVVSSLRFGKLVHGSHDTTDGNNSASNCHWNCPCRCSADTNDCQSRASPTPNGRTCCREWDSRSHAYAPCGESDTRAQDTARDPANCGTSGADCSSSRSTGSDYTYSGSSSASCDGDTNCGVFNLVSSRGL